MSTLLARFIDNNVVRHVSMGGIDPRRFWFHNWKNFIIDFTSPIYQIRRSFGGHVFNTFGEISFSPDLSFTDIAMPVELYRTETNDEELTPIYFGTMHRKAISPRRTVFSLYDYVESTYLLDEGVNVDGETVVIPRLFGFGRHIPLLKLEDYTDSSGTYPCYHGAYITGTLHSDWHMFDDGVDICSGVTDLGDGSYALDSPPAGEVTATGFGAYGTLVSLLTWGCGRLGYDIDATLLRTSHTGTYDDIRLFATSQERLIDFMDRAAAMCTHMTYLK